MSNAKYIGRVGGLAVALGVGIAVATPGVGWADDTGSASSEGSTGTAGGAGTAGTSQSESTSATIGSTAEPAGTSTVAGSPTEGAYTPGSGSVDASESGTSASTGASVRQVSPGMVMSTGGADSSTKSNSEPSASGDVAAALTTDESLSKPVADSTARGRSNRQQQQRVGDPAGAQGVDANTLTATGTPLPLRPEVSPPRRILVNVAAQRPAAQQPVTAANPRPYLPTQASFVAQAVSAARTEPTKLPGTVRAVVMAALATAGLGPLAATGPSAPVDSPLGLVLAAWGTRRRPFAQPAAEDTRSLASSPTLTSLNVDGEQAFAALVTAAVTNSAPVVAAQPVGIPDPVTGVVTGTVIATDADNNTLTYAVAGDPTGGTVQLNSQTGAYTYTPTPAARLAAGATATADTDSFTVAVSDGQQTTTAAVSVYISPTRLENKTPIAVGTNPSGAAISPAPNDPRMYVANTGSNTVSVINTATGKRIDANSGIFSTDIKVGSSPSALAVSPDGKRLYVANTGSGTVSVINTDTYQLIDTNTGAFGTQSISVGSSPSALALGADGRLYVANTGSNTVSVINTTTNALVDTNPNASGTNSISVGSSPSALVLGADGRLYVANRGSGTVSVINTSSYSVTNTITVGSQPASVALGADGLYVANTGNATVSVINTITNTLVDTNPNALGTNPISVGPSPSSVALSPDGSLAYVANANDTVSVIDTKNYTVVSTVAIDSDPTGGHVIAVSPNGTIYVTDAADGTVRVLTVAESGVSAIGNVTITGDRPGSLVLSADGTRAVLITAYPIGRVTFASYPDGIRGSTTRVAVIDTASGSQVGTTFTMTGPHAAGVQLSADGTRLLITSSAYDATGTRVALLNTTTGTQVGTTFTLTGGGSAQFIANDSRALITTVAYSPSTNTTTTRVAVLNTTTGTQAGATLALAGNGSAALSPDGAHALIITDAKVAAINIVTGNATTAALTGSWVLERWSADSSRALISSRVTDAAGTTTRVSVIDTITGTQIGTTLTLTGYGSLQYSADGTRALITSSVTNAAGATTRVAVFNTTSGTQIGTTLTLVGDGNMEFGPDGTRVLITTDVYDSATALHTTRVTMFNTTTGTQTGTLSLTGGPYNRQPVFSPDGARALITTTVYDSATTLHTSRVTMFDTATGAQMGTTLTLTGPDVAETTWRADGTRALITMTPTQYDSVVSPMLVAVIDKAGNQIGTTLTLPGMPGYGNRPAWSPDGTRALITTDYHNLTTGENTTRVTTIDTTTGSQAGTTVTLTGNAFNSRTVLSPNGNRAIVTAGDQVAIINTTTGTQVGTTVAIDGAPSALQFSPNGSRAVITTAFSVVVIDTTAGTQVGSTLTLTSPRPIMTLLTADGTHALVTSDFRHFGTPGVLTTPVAVIDLTTGTQTGTALSLIGDTYALPAFTLNDTRALIATGVDDPTNGVSTTRVTTINTATGMPTGTTVTLTGILSSGVGNPLRVVLSPDGARALIATTSAHGGTGTSQVAVINAATGTQIGNTVTINGALSGLRWSTDGTRVFVTTYITTATGADLSIQETVLKTL